MADDMKIEIDGLEDLMTDLKALNNEVPGAAIKCLKRLGSRFIVDVRHNAPEEFKSTLQGKFWKKHIRESCSMARGYVARMDIVNASNLHHLMENGHMMLDHEHQPVGMGFVPGYHYTEKTRQAWSGGSQMAEELETIIDKEAKKHNL